MKHIALAVLVLVSTPALAGACQIDKHQALIDTFQKDSPARPETVGRRFALMANELSAEMTLHAADLLLRDECLDAADEMYRLVLSRYTEPELAGVRDQAKVGIDDVRAARRR